MNRTVVHTDRFSRGVGSTRDNKLDAFSSGNSIGSLPLLVSLYVNLKSSAIVLSSFPTLFHDSSGRFRGFLEHRSAFPELRSFESPSTTSAFDFFLYFRGGTWGGHRVSLLLLVRLDCLGWEGNVLRTRSGR
uniref:Uncharacterized protein n=1 Tax=Cacopsylla melanoneura TaxID=428564 RepID=A0A8D9AH40_9HEMI